MRAEKIMTRHKMVIEVDCQFRNNVGACETSSGINSYHCLHCPLGQEWIAEHIHVLQEDTSWGLDATNALERG